MGTEIILKIWKKDRPQVKKIEKKDRPQLKKERDKYGRVFTNDATLFSD